MHDQLSLIILCLCENKRSKTMRLLAVYVHRIGC